MIARMGDMLGLIKGAIVNAVVRHIKKMVPPHDLPDAHSFKEALAIGSRLTLQTPTLGPNDIAFLQYTGGTTGVSKGATLTHRNVVANILQANAWLEPALMQEPRVEQLFMVAALPLYHIFALTACALMCVRLGGVCLLIPNPRDIPNLLKELAKYPVNFFPAVNTLFNAMLNHPDFGKVDWSHLKSRGRRRHGGAARGRRALACRDRQADHRSLRPVGNLAWPHRQSMRHRRMVRHHRLSRFHRPRLRSSTSTTKKCRLAKPARFARAVRR